MKVWKMSWTPGCMLTLKAGAMNAASSNPPAAPCNGRIRELAALIQEEGRRESNNIELIASENFTSPSVREAQGSLLTNKYAEGYPGKRWYGGCEVVDKVEQIAIDRVLEIFGGDHANVQPHSGSQANMAVYFSVLKPGDTILTMDLSHGGHLTHGHRANFSGKLSMWFTTAYPRKRKLLTMMLWKNWLWR